MNESPSYFLKGQPRPPFVYFCFFDNKFTEKLFTSAGFKLRSSEGKYDDHLTTTTAQGRHVHSVHLCSFCSISLQISFILLQVVSVYYYIGEPSFVGFKVAFDLEERNKLSTVTFAREEIVSTSSKKFSLICFAIRWLLGLHKN